MYHVTVRNHMMVAHSFKGAVFGPAQKLHGATYVVDVTFYRAELDADDLVVDIGAASSALANVLGAFNLGNLDDHAELAGHNTTTEFMARVIFDRVRAAIAAGQLGAGAKGLARMAVRLAESHVAWAGYEADL
ncbi:MAG: 6-carboxytetrahydropterin synthase [Burkholderiaceae bacterium]|jgi:6-pyruvoyl-tetrahydropterin synthase|nr:MAG: 6-carboxytetrahydropterin synthase [Burkholderiaceae bacterium]